MKFNFDQQENCKYYVKEALTEAKLRSVFCFRVTNSGPMFSETRSQ